MGVVVALQYGIELALLFQYGTTALKLWESSVFTTFLPVNAQYNFNFVPV